MSTFRILPFREIPILLYHRIEPKASQYGLAGLSIPPQSFEAQLQFLKENHYRIVDLDVALAMKSGKIPLERNCVSITFDDGYLGTFTEAFPLLLRHEITATVFIVPHLMGKLSAWHRQYPARLMDWSHAREMMKYGIRFANHTFTHPDLTRLDNARASEEIGNAHKRIEDSLGVTTKLLSYPYGAFTRDLMRIVESMGYDYALAAHQSENSRFCLERFAVYTGDSLFRFSLKACEWGTWMRNLRDWGGPNTGEAHGIYADRGREWTDEASHRNPSQKRDIRNH